MKNKLILILITISIIAHGQNTTTPTPSPEEEVEAAVNQLIKGIENADSKILDSIAAEELIYGHSNGKVQNKKEFIDEIAGLEPFIYTDIKLTEQTIKITGSTAIVRHTFEAQTIGTTTTGKLKIGNLLVWQLQNNKWKLLARQAYR
jgi:hypothetical protein